MITKRCGQKSTDTNADSGGEVSPAAERDKRVLKALRGDLTVLPGGAGKQRQSFRGRNFGTTFKKKLTASAF